MVKTITRIIFVCTGNTCRSPMAEVIAKNMVKDNSLEILSRGIFVPYPVKANDYAKETVKKYNLSLEDHQATPFDHKEVTQGTLVLTMTEQHKMTLLRQYPHLAPQIATLYGFLGKKGDINDPYGMPLEIYEQCFKHLGTRIQEMIEKLEGNE